MYTYSAGGDLLEYVVDLTSKEAIDLQELPLGRNSGKSVRQHIFPCKVTVNGTFQNVCRLDSELLGVLLLQPLHLLSAQ